MTVLALDPATACGWAIMPYGVSGVKDLTPTGKNLHPGKRYQRLRNLMRDKRTEFPDISLIAYELPIGESTSQIQKAYSHGYVAIIQLFCAEHGLGSRGIYSGTLKKFVTGRGNASKDEMIAAIKARGFNPQSHDEADAIGIALWASQ